MHPYRPRRGPELIAAPASRLRQRTGVDVVRVRTWTLRRAPADASTMTDTAVAIATESLTKFYGARRGLEALDLTVPYGEVFGFLGPNGAGKTTTIRLLLDFIRPTRGRATVLGVAPRDGVAARRRIGYLPGELAFEGRDRVRDLLGYLAAARGGVAPRRVADLAERLQLDLDRPIRALSKGNKQKVGLVQAFMHDPELLVLDEPTSGLDPLMQQEFVEMVREARAAGQTVFMSSHVLAEVQHTADRVGILRDGRLVAVERVESLGKRAVRHVELHFDAVVPADEFIGLAGVRDVTVEGPVLRCLVDGPLDPLVKAAARHTVVDLLSTEPDLEETFLSYYYETEGAGRAA
jgi:ABC-2 type transport system ATP-binding protein